MQKIVAFLSALAFLIFAAAAHAAELNVSAASSLTDVLKEIGGLYEKQGGDHVVYNFAASSLLARQIEEHAPADVFISADEEKMNRLQTAGLVVEKSRRVLLSNSLVIVASSQSALAIAAPEDLLGAKIEKIAVADPKAVPAGIYTRTYLTGLGMWEKLVPKVVPVENVRAALAVAESGDADAAFVYKTDAMTTDKVKVLFRVPVETTKISYPAAVLKSATNAKSAEKFLHFLESEPAKKIFTTAGFIVKS